MSVKQQALIRNSASNSEKALMYDQIRRFRQQLTEQIAQIRKPIEDKQLAEQQEALEDYLTSRHVDTVYHFTPIENLSSICRHGILSRDQVTNLFDSDILFPDRWRTDRATWGICCSIEWPNYKMMYMKKRYDSFTFAVIALDASVLWELDCVFLPGNASRADLSCQIPVLRKNRFDRLHQLKALYPEPDYRPLGYWSYPEDVQAEVIVAESPIDLSYFREIYFQSIFHARQAEILPWPKHIACELRSEVFKVRPDQQR